MAEVSEHGELGASIDDVWKLVSDFGGFPAAMGLSVEVDGEGIGQTRTLSMGGPPMVERLEELDAETKRVVYSIVQGPMPFTDYRATMQLAPAGEGRTALTWSGTFEPAEGTSADDSAALVRRIYQGGIAALQGRFGA